MKRYRMALFWERDDLDLDLFTNRLSMFLSAMRGIEPALSGWQPEDVREALKAAATPFPEGGDRIVYRASFFAPAQPAEREAEPEMLADGAGPALVPPPKPGERAAELFLTWGLEPFDALPVWTPNRLALRVHAGIGKHGVTPALAQTLLRTAATTFKADWGVVGSVDEPNLPGALTSRGAPVVGWITYLRNVYGALPPIEPPAIVQPVTDGHLITAIQQRYDDNDAEHARVIDKLRAALTGAGVLRPKPRA